MAGEKSATQVLNELRGGVSLNPLPFRPHTPSEIDTREYVQALNEQRVAQGLNKIGDSRYDKRAVFLEDLANIDDLRGREQSGALQVLNGLGKGATIAATTYLNGTLGTLYGITTGIQNMFDNDETTSFRSGLWNNKLNKALADIQEKMESLLPNYYTDDEKNKKWYQNIFTANFLGDKLLKNAGFTVGAMATMATPGFNTAFGVGRLATALAKGVGAGLKIARGAGKVATVLGNSFISANGEANIEAYQAAKSFTDANKAYLEQRLSEGRKQIEEEYQQAVASGVSPEQAMKQAMQREQFLQELENDTLKKIKDEATGVGNSTWMGNIAALMVSNNLQFARMLRGGYGTSNLLKGVTLKANGEITKSLTDFGKALAKGTAGIEAKEINKVGLRTALGVTKNMLSEGSEEMAQNLISGTAQSTHSAQLNQWAEQKHRSDKDKYSLFSSSINPNVTKQYVDTLKSLGKVWNDEFGSFDKGGWEEFFLGAITGGLGTLSIRKQNPNEPSSKRIKIGWQGGIYEAFNDIQEERKDNERRAEFLKDFINKPEFKERTRHAIASMTIAQDMEDALTNQDVFSFKNSELMSIVNDALFFKNAGMIDAYKAYYEEMAKGLSDEDVESIRTLTLEATDKSGSSATPQYQSYFDNVSSDKIKQLFKDKAVSTLEKINNAVNHYEDIQSRYGNKISRAAGEDAGLAEWVIRETAVDQTLVDDLKKRKNELEAQEDKDDKANKDLNKIDNTIDYLEKKIKETLKDPKTRIQELQKIQERQEKIQVGKDAEATNNLFHNATSLKEVASAFLYADPEQRDKFFREALNTAEGDNKKLLQSFEKFATQVNALPKALDAVVKAEFPQLEGDGINAIKNRIGSIVDGILEDLSEDNVNRFDSSSLSNNFKRVARDIVKDIDDVENPIQKISMVQDAALLDSLAKALEDLEAYQKNNRNKDRRKETNKNSFKEDKGSSPNINFGNEEESQQPEQQPVQEPIEPEPQQPSEPEIPTQPEQQEGQPKVEEEEPEVEETPKQQPIQQPTTQQEEPQQPEPAPEENSDTGNHSVKGDVIVTPVGKGNNNIESMPIAADEEALINTNQSMQGIFYKYRRDTVRDRRPIKYGNRNAVEYLKKKGIDLDYIVDNVLTSIYQHRNGNVQIKYMKYTDRNHIFAITPITRNELNGYLSKYSQLANNAVIQDNDGNTYLICGHLQGEYNNVGFKKELARIHNDISRGSIANGVQIGNTVTEIDGMFDGHLITNNDTFNNVKELLNNPEANPNKLEAKTLNYIVIEGTVETPYIKFIGEINGLKQHRNLDEYIKQNMYPGQVFIAIPNNNNVIQPAYVKPQSFANNNIDTKSAYWKGIENTIANVIKNKNPKDRLKALSNLRDLLLFSPNPAFDLYYSINETSKEYNKLYARINGNKTEYIDFNDVNLSVPDAISKLYGWLNQLNPSFNISTKVLMTPEGRKMYVDAGLITTSVNKLAVENNVPYFKSLEGREQGQYQPSQWNKPETKTSDNRTFYTLNNQEYYIEEGRGMIPDKVMDAFGEIYGERRKQILDCKRIYDNDGVKLIKDSYGETMYADVEGRMYAIKYKGIYETVTEEQRNKILRKEDLKEANQKIQEQISKETFTPEPASLQEKIEDSDPLFPFDTADQFVAESNEAQQPVVENRTEPIVTSSGEIINTNTDNSGKVINFATLSLEAQKTNKALFRECCAKLNCKNPKELESKVKNNESLRTMYENMLTSDSKETATDMFNQMLEYIKNCKI